MPYHEATLIIFHDVLSTRYISIDEDPSFDLYLWEGVMRALS